MTYLFEAITPTRIYHKQCSHCGLNYLGKTVKADIENYSGSGVHWTRHLKKHNAQSIHIWNSDWFYDTSIVDYALDLSEKLNIVESKEWANEKLENGLDGGWDHYNGTEEKIESSRKGGIITGSIIKERLLEGDYEEGSWMWWASVEGRKERSRLGALARKEKYPDGFSWTQTQEALNNQKKALQEIGHQQGEKNSQFGTIWITNGKENLKIPKDSNIPEGFKKGRVIKKTN